MTDRSAAMISMKAILVHADDTLRRKTNRMTPTKLARHLAALRPRNLETPAYCLRHAQRSLADGSTWTAKPRNSGSRSRRSSIAPQRLEQFGIGVDTAVEILIVAGDNPERIHSEAAFAKLAGISPVPTGSGMTSGRHRINHGGHRQLNAAIYRTVIVQMRFHEPTIAYVARRAAEGRSKRDVVR
ncbi:IS110 family transposase [Brachybacterium sp. GCM10030252]|uniref:IS110 family transposase n=1 Tax=Brachybacterium sp. GCM10030252 TaxID=3273380 RepID=UPI003615AE82